MTFEYYVLEAIERVLFWELPDYDLGRAVSDQAAVLARIGPEQHCDASSD
jgi:hypothetical protein